MPSKSEWERHLKRIYEEKASVEEVAEELDVPKEAVRHRYDKFLKELLDDREKKLDQIDKEVSEKERKIKSLSEGIERADEKLEETEEKLSRMSKLEEKGKKWEQKIQNFADKWRETKKIARNFLIIIGIILALVVGSYLLFTDRPQRAEFRAENLKISSNSGFVGETITVSLDVVNVGGEADTYETNLNFNGISIEEKSIGLSPGERRTITLTGKVEQDGNIKVEVNGLKENFTAFKPFPFKGAYVKYETEGDVNPFGKASGTETYEVTEVTGEDYTWSFNPSGDIEVLSEAGIIKEAREYTTSLETPITITEDETWENFAFVENVTKNTEFGTMKLSLYLGVERGERTKIRSVYLEKETKIPIRYELIFKNPDGILIGKVVETNIDYLKEK